MAALQGADFNLDLLGIDATEVARLLAEERGAAGLPGEDALPELPKSPAAATGDLWLLGSHRLLVGDPTDPAAVRRLMMGQAADLVFTDLFSDVNYQTYARDQTGTQVLHRLLAMTFANYRRVVRPTASVYVCHPWSRQREFQTALEGAGFKVRCQIIWAEAVSQGRDRYKFMHEPVFYAHVAEQEDAWYGDKSQSTVWVRLST
ncbi:MAG: hypothetical protein ABSH56_05100 [Bryobacteraceae bacterium]